MTPITIDIETDYTHDPLVVERLASKIQPPANYKSEEAIAKWWDREGNNKKVEAQRKTALKALWGSIKMIGMQHGDGDPLNGGGTNMYTGDERQLLIDFFDDLNYFFGEYKSPPLIVGHNIKGFDLTFIRQRALLLGVNIPSWMNVYFTRYSNDVFDTQYEWSGEMVYGKDAYVKLDDLAYAFLGESKTSDGAASLDMTDAECAEYCKQDVALTYKIYQCMTGVK